jgi:hypothetical protein
MTMKLMTTAAFALLLASTMPAAAQSVGGWNEGLSGGASAMNPDPHAQRDSQVRSSGYRTWDQRFLDWLNADINARHAILDQLEAEDRRLEALARQLRGSENNGFSGRDGSPNAGNNK